MKFPRKLRVPVKTPNVDLKNMNLDLLYRSVPKKFETGGLIKTAAVLRILYGHALTPKYNIELQFDKIFYKK